MPPPFCKQARHTPADSGPKRQRALPQESPLSFG